MSPSAVLALSTATATFVIVACLLVIAAVMTGVAVWLVRRTRRDVPALGPLEVLGQRAWRRAGAEQRVEILAAARPEGAPDPAPMLDEEIADDDGIVDDDGGAADATVPIETSRAPGNGIEVEVLHRYHPVDG